VLSVVKSSAVYESKNRCLDLFFKRTIVDSKEKYVEESKQMEKRAKKAAEIAAKPQLYKVCEGCESIVMAKATTCPSCHGYRFDDEPQRVIDQAILLGSRPATTLSHEDFQ